MRWSAAVAWPSMQWAQIFSRTATPCPCLRLDHRPPLRDRGLVPLHCPVDRDLRRAAHPVQQERHPAQRVEDPEQASGQARDARGQRPAPIDGVETGTAEQPCRLVVADQVEA
jgi:hypothetical protein